MCMYVYVYLYVNVHMNVFMLSMYVCMYVCMQQGCACHSPLHLHYLSTTSALPQHYTCTTSVLHLHYLSTTPTLPQHYTYTTSTLHLHYLNTTPALPQQTHQHVPAAMEDQISNTMQNPFLHLLVRKNSLSSK